MAWYHYLWPFGQKRKKRIEEVRAVSEHFKSQLQEALLRHDDLNAATERMRLEREARIVVRKRLDSKASLKKAIT